MRIHGAWFFYREAYNMRERWTEWTGGQEAVKLEIYRNVTENQARTPRWRTIRDTRRPGLPLPIHFLAPSLRAASRCLSNMPLFPVEAKESRDPARDQGGGLVQIENACSSQMNVLTFNLSLSALCRDTMCSPCRCPLNTTAMIVYVYISSGTTAVARAEEHNYCSRAGCETEKPAGDKS